MKEKGAGGYAVFFGKPQEQPEAMQIFNAENGTGSKHEPEAMPIS